MKNHIDIKIATEKVPCKRTVGRMCPVIIVQGRCHRKQIKLNLNNSSFLLNRILKSFCINYPKIDNGYSENT